MKLLGKDIVPGGVEKYWLHTGDDGQDRITIETQVDVEPILNQNKAKYAAASSSFAGGDMHEVATIPGIVLEKAAKLHGITWGELMAGKTDKARAALNELLNGREFRAFRTKPGKVDVSRGIR